MVLWHNCGCTLLITFPNDCSSNALRYLILYRPSWSDSNVCASNFHIQCILPKVTDLNAEIFFLSRVNNWQVARKQIFGVFRGGAQAMFFLRLDHWFWQPKTGHLGTPPNLDSILFGIWNSEISHRKKLLTKIVLKKSFLKKKVFLRLDYLVCSPFESWSNILAQPIFYNCNQKRF